MDDRDEYEPEAEAPAEPITERVRIIGAQPAGVVAGHGPPGGESAEPDIAPEAPEAPEATVEDPRGTLFGGAELAGTMPPEDTGHAQLPGRNGGDPLEPGAQPLNLAEPPAGVPDMPHWTDPPTGQVPAVLDRRGDEDEGPWSATGDTGPSWRQHQHEWDDSGFDPSLLGDEETRVGALEETPVEERRPWEFDDLGTATPASEEPAAHDRPGAGSWWDEPDEDAPAPSRPDRPVVPAAGPGVTDGGVDEGAERGVASISSSPLRVAARDLAAPTPPGARGITPRARGNRPGAGGAGPGPGSGQTTGPASGRDMPVAIATGLGIAVVAVACFELGSVATLVLATVVVALAAAECYAALRRSGRHPATFLGLVATVGVMVAAYAKGVSAVPLVLVLVVITSMVWYLVGAERGSAVDGVASTVLGFAWVGLLGSFAALMLAPSQYPHRHGVAFLVGAVVATVGADVGALAIGSWLGRHPLSPRVSPHKTWEGLIGGAVVAIVLSAAITGQIHPWTVPKAALLGLVVAVVAPIGDLCESLVKRDLGLKDLGSMLPGHGGVLDRVDALLFVLPATYYLVRVLNLG